MTLLGYARVSTTHQSVDMQVRALKNAGAEHIWTEQMSGGRDDRPALAELLAAAATGDVLMVWRLDRLGRSLPHLLTVAADVGPAILPVILLVGLACVGYGLHLARKLELGHRI